MPRLRTLLLLCFCALLFACRKQDSRSPDTPKPTHVDPAGFSLTQPAGWNVSVKEGAYIDMAAPDGSARGIVFPFVAARPMTAVACLEQAPAAFREQMAGARLVESKLVRPPNAEAIGRYTHKKGEARALCSMEGRSGILYLAIADAAVAATALPALKTAFESLEFYAPALGGVAPKPKAPEEVDFIDPIERAFRIKVPRGWKAQGGLYRFAPVDVRAQVHVTSPDGETLVVLGDKEIPPLATPMFGFPEGSAYNPGYGVNFLVKRFTPGAQFAAEYARGAARKLGCPGDFRVRKNELPQLTRQLQSAANQTAAGMIRIVASAGEARFDCGEKAGYVFAATQLMTQSADGSGTWNVTQLAGYLTPRRQEADTRHVLTRIYETIRVEPAWAGAQQQTTAATSRIVAKTGEQIATIFRESAANTQKSMDRVYRNWSNATLGQTDVVDPDTGDTYKVAAGKNYYWRKVGTDVGAGTDTYDRPDIDFTPLVEF
jgi:hypothetical protein